MERQEWVARCSLRLHEQWPRVPREQLEEVAEELRGRALRQLDEPELAASEWLQRGMPTERNR
jgi:hypothetical protein